MKLQFVLVLTALACQALARPQVSTDEILKGAEGGGYGQSSQQVDQDFLDEVFGTGSDDDDKNVDDGYDGNDNDKNANVNDDGYDGDGVSNDDFDDGGAGGEYDNQSGHINDNYTPPKEENRLTDTKSHNCSDYYEDGFRCVPYYLCDEFGTIVTDGGPGLIDIRSSFGVEIEIDSNNTKCDRFLDVCCRLEGYDDPVIEKTTPKPVPQKYISRCGQRHSNGIGVRIQNPYGASTQFGEWPHMCAVLEDKDDKNLYVCGGSLIAPGIVMTAAHCVDKYLDKTLKVRCGEWDTQETLEPVEHQERYVEHISMHPEYSPRNLSHDIALLHTEYEFELSDHIDVICLPDGDLRQESYNWEECFATGWGKDDFGVTGEYQVVLKQVELNMVNHSYCEDQLRTTRLTDLYNLDQSFICAGGESKVDTCKGDGGGPLVCPRRTSANIDDIHDNSGGNSYGIIPKTDSNDDLDARAPAIDHNYVQSGIVSWGIGCGEDGIPGVYTDVAEEACFIDYAARCINGDSVGDSMGIGKSCRGWARRARRRVVAARNGYRDRANELTGRSKRKLLKKVRQHNDILQKYKAAKDSCGTIFDHSDFSDDFEDDNNSDFNDDGQDISGYQRNNNEQLVEKDADADDDDDDNGEVDTPQKR